MRGFNHGGSILLELCMSYDVFCQEHWLLPDQLNKLSDISDE